MPRDIIAILGGVHPDRMVVIGDVLIQCVITTIQVPLNSPKPFDSIRRLTNHYRLDAQIGAGTVLSVENVQRVVELGSQLIVSPDTAPDVIQATEAANLASFPGVMTPTDFIAALQNGADELKFFPSSIVGVDGFRAIRAVLPPSTNTFAVGGSGPENFKEWLAASITEFGIGSAL